MCVPKLNTGDILYTPLNYYHAEGKQISSIFMHLYFNAKTAGACHYFFRFCKVAKVAQYKRHDNNFVSYISH